MLKWTKRAEPGGSGDAGSKLSTLLLAPQPNTNQRLHARRSLGNLSRPARTANRERQRKSLGSSELSKRIQNRDKENQVVLTPHPNGFRQNITSTPVIAFGSKLDYALRDVRNITPKHNSNSISALINAMTPSRKRPLAKTPPDSPKVDRVICSSPKESALASNPASVMLAQQTPYASTLPTFDVEYSPCGATQPILPNPMNSITVTTDSFFNQPRYFQEPLPASKRLKFSPGGMTPHLTELRFSKLKFGSKRSTAPSVGKKSEKTTVKEVELVGVESGNNNNNDNNKNQNECITNDANLMKKPMTPTKLIASKIPSTETSLSSSALDDTALDKMIDAILESARKERPSIVRNLAPRKIHMALMQMGSDSPTYTPAEDPASDLNKFCDNFQISPDKLIGERTIILEEPNAVNEREVRTPEPTQIKRKKVEKVESKNGKKAINSCYLKRQRAVRRKHTKCDQQKEKSEAMSVDGDFSTEQNESPKPETETSELVSPKTPSDSDFVMSSFFKKSVDELANMNTPVIDSSDVNLTYAPQPHCGITSIGSKMSIDSTPCINTNDLQASSTPTHIETVNAIRRCLTFSDSSPSGSGSSTTTDDSLEKRKSTASSTNSIASISNLSNSIRTNGIVSGSLELTIHIENNKIHIHVIRCRDLSRSNGGQVNAYVKVALISDTTDSGFQRTAVHCNSHRPYFDHRFTFDLCGNEMSRIQLAVWHRDREFKRSEFLGCLSVPVKSVASASASSSKEINGSFKLQPKSCLTVNTPLIAMGENSQSSVDEAINNDDGLGTTPLTLSKKAIHQRDADENLFLRFLELDPPIESATPQPPPTPQTGELRRKSTLKSKEHPAVSKEHPAAVQSHNQNGRTPFTITKKLTRTAEKGFGFSIVWTHPPRIEKVEQGLSADRCGILPGDYVIFVDKHNVVTMPEMDILNLIKTQGNTLVLEIFRRSNSARPTTNGINARVPSLTNSMNANMMATHASSLLNNNDDVSSEFATPKQSTSSLAARPMTACSNISLTLESTKRRLQLPQVTFSKESMVASSIEDAPRRYLYQLMNREQHFVTALQYGMQRFVSPLLERRDLISQTDHRTLFQNIEEILRLSEDILEQLLPDEHEPQLMFASRVYLSKSTAFCAAYKKYCNGLKRADCVLVNKSRQSNSEFVTFITVPQVPRKRPDMTTLIHRPLQHFREVLKLIILLASHCRSNSEECKNFTHVISALQTSYREITVNEGIMEPLGEGRPLLTLQDLEARLVFTKCKPFVLAIPGRQWIFGGDLSRVEGRSVKPYWTLLFSDILLFAKVSRDRVLFITEEPIPLANIIDSCFNIRKKHTEFRITIDPNGRAAESPTVHCTPDLSRTPRKGARKQIILRAPSQELKAVWQNLIQRQVFLVNATLGSTLSSPLESPDILQRFLPVNEIEPATTSMASIKLSADSINTKSQQSQATTSRQFDELVDEKCRLLNKNGTSHGSALHLAQWMKGQFDESIKKLTEENSLNDIMTEDENEELIEEWSQEQLRKRSQELQLMDENGKCIMPLLDNIRRGSETVDRNRLTADDGMAGEFDDGSKSASTTSDSQTTVRSSPVTKKIDKLSVCRHCHKNCKQKSQKTSSLKVQHSQSSSSRCCASTSSQGSEKSASSRTSNHSNGNANDLKLSLIKNKSCEGSPASQKTVTTSTCSNSNALNNNILCKCKCTTADFENTIRIPYEVRKETCKILNSVNEIQTISHTANWQHANCNCDNVQTIRESKISNLNENEYIKSTSEISNVDDWSSKLIGSSQFRAIPNVMRDKNDPFKAVPQISVVPPTPDGITSATMRRSHWEQISSEQSAEDSPQDELPYRALNTTLKRYGTMSSLEKLPSEEADDKTYNSSGTETNDDDDDIRIVTKEIYDGNTRNWTNRAGSFLEQSRAFLDSYLGRWDRSNQTTIHDDERDDSVPENGEECTSGATSGEEVWGTPTSGENDEIQMFNSDQTSPTKSSSSLTGDDDTELMMDELLMAPPMTASTIRGLLPRRRLEPLFEEDTESSSESDENENDERMVRDFSSSDQAGASSTENLYSKWSRCGKRRRRQNQQHRSIKKYVHRKHFGKTTSKRSLYRGTIEKGNRLWRHC
ncbi:uncharacterized protein LOC116348077 isoform X3 [Contarinia nasturtii]|uniref:uncharacterized protein LOC116348077 isoform X3 n=1 Tax=Contarinia nasturtii TaxID=265458 RepID=UPI0012D3737D|nr:uncharacterized protein LOC116348077 isoform X3 [Contarinia nasturtii]